MSVLIKGMKMPKNCDDCSLRSFSFDGMICSLINENVTNQEFAYKRHPNCPLSEVPTPHGDLIDRDDLLDILDKIILKPDSPVQRCMAMAVKEILIGQPTVIESEE